MARHGTFAYTWDLVGDPAAADRIAGLGVDTVTLQAVYHSVRAVTPFHPAHRVVHAEHAAAYFPVREERWAGQRLRPRTPDWGVPDDDRFGTAAAALTSAGLRVEAWLVLTHSSAIGATAPELTVHNAFGERYPYALCPAHPAVREYALTLIDEVCAHYDVPALMLEACGWLGFDHGSHHEKTSGADLSDTGRALLSVCLCLACRTGLVDHGVDPARLAADIRLAVDRELRTGRPAGDTLADAIGADRAWALHQHRTNTIAGLLRSATALAGEREVLLMVADDPQVTGPDVGVDLTTFPAPADAFVLKCWGAEDPAVAQVKAAAERTAAPVVANVTALEDHPDTLTTRVGRLLAAGARQIRYYHAGLASPARLKAVRDAVHGEEP